jgi:6-phosphogluconolactonase
MMKRLIIPFFALLVAGCASNEPTSPMPDEELSVSLHQQGGDDDDDDERGGSGVVYTQSNATGGNSILVFERASDGSLDPAGSVAAGGSGTGSGLGSQGAVILSRDSRYLFAVNAGSNQVSSFKVKDDGKLELVDVDGSGGSMPISVTAHGRLLYVLNAGGAGNITGFRIGHDGELTPIANSTRPLSSPASGPAQVGFSPDGGLLIVAEKNTNVLSAYRVQRDGRAIGPIVNASNGVTPFGFAFDRRGHLLVSEAFGGAPDASATSSYAVRRNGTLRVISGSVPTTETAACWLVITRNGKYAYVTNTGSASVTGYRIGNNGSLTVLDADGKTGNTGSSPIDAALSRGSRFLYTLDANSQTITGFRVNANGSLGSIGQTSGIPAGAAGLAAR